MRLCVRIGAGEYRESIIELLRRFTSSDNVGALSVNVGMGRRVCR